jgi:tetratricopeptide (TPR) repeat protein
MSRSEGSIVHRHCTLAQLSELLGVPCGRIRAWVKAGLVQPAASEQGELQFDFRQITGAKTLAKLSRAGVKVSKIRRCLDQLRAWFPEVEEPLAQLALLEENGQVLIRLEAGQLAEPSGQQHFDFEAQAESPKPAMPCKRAEPWRQRGHYLEDAGQLEAAELAYRQALLEQGPDAELCFNLGNVLFALGRKEQAVERFRQAVELDPDYPEAWNNLGNILAELNQAAEAVEAYQRALALNPQLAEAHYNLADILDEMGQAQEAQRRWRSYLRLEPQGPWAEYAKQRLAALSTQSG